MHDDVIVKTSFLKSLDTTLPWCSTKFKNGDVGVHNLNEQEWETPRNSTIWGWLKQDMGVKALKASYAEDGVGNTMLQCNAGDIRRVYVGKADFFYIPQRFCKSFMQIGGIFAKHRLFLEIAIVTFQQCFTNGSKLEKVPFCDVSARIEEIGNMTLTNEMVMEGCPHLDGNINLIHPVKLSAANNWPLFLQFLHGGTF